MAAVISKQSRSQPPLRRLFRSLKSLRVKSSYHRVDARLIVF